MSKLTKEEQIYERFVYRITRKEKEDIHRHSAEGSDDRRYRHFRIGRHPVQSDHPASGCCYGRGGLLQAAVSGSGVRISLCERRAGYRQDHVQAEEKKSGKLRYEESGDRCSEKFPRSWI